MSFLRFGIFVTVILSFSVVTHARELTKEQWVDSFTRSLLAVFCDSGQFFRECFDVSKEECEDTASSATENCINEHLDEMPEVFTVKDGHYWGTVIGECVGKEYATERSYYIKDSAECKDQSKWK